MTGFCSRWEDGIFRGKKFSSQFWGVINEKHTLQRGIIPTRVLSYRVFFITARECVYCAVRTESLNIIQDNLNP